MKKKIGLVATMLVVSLAASFANAPAAEAKSCKWVTIADPNHPDTYYHYCTYRRP